MLVWLRVWVVVSVCSPWDSLGTCSGCTLPRSLLQLSGLWMVVFILWHFVLFSLFLHGVSQLPCRTDSAQTHTSDIRAGRRGMAQTIHPLNNHKGSLLGGRWKKGVWQCIVLLHYNWLCVDKIEMNWNMLLRHQKKGMILTLTFHMILIPDSWFWFPLKRSNKCWSSGNSTRIQRLQLFWLVSVELKAEELCKDSTSLQVLVLCG